MPKKPWHPALTPSGLTNRLAKIALFFSPRPSTGHVLRTAATYTTTRCGRQRRLLRCATTEEDTHMADLPPYGDTGDDAGVGPDRGSTTSIPRWVTVFGIVI